MYSHLRYILLFIATISISIHTLKAQISDTLYDNAYNNIDSMLSGVSSLNFRKAVLYTEDTYHEDTLDEDIFDYHIKLYTSICKGIMESGSLEYTEKDVDIAFAQCAVFMFMTDTVDMQFGDKVIQCIPFSYNHDDFAGQKDWSNMFVSTLMGTNKGNCHSMPYLYKMITDEPGYQSHLALAPDHIYFNVQTRSNNTTLSFLLFS